MALIMHPRKNGCGNNLKHRNLPHRSAARPVRIEAGRLKRIWRWERDENEEEKRGICRFAGDAGTCMDDI